MNIEHLMKDVVNDVFTISKKLPDVLKFKGRLDTIISDAFAESLKNIGEYPKIKDNQDLIDQYFSGVHVFIFKYQGKLFPFERSTIDQFASGWCGLLNGCNYIAFTELKTKNKYFEKINNAILLKDFYGQKVIHGLYDIQDYIQMIIHDPAYQKHIILPKMEHIKNKGTRNNVIL